MIKIRKPEISDYRECLDLLSELGPRYEVNPDDERSKKLFKRYMDHEDKLGFVAEDENGKIAGCLFIEIGEMFCKTYMQGRGEGMVVSSQYRNRGVAKKLLNTMLEELKNRGVLNCVIRTPYDWNSYKIYQKLDGWNERGGYFYYNLSV